MPYPAVSRYRAVQVERNTRLFLKGLGISLFITLGSAAIAQMLIGIWGSISIGGVGFLFLCIWCCYNAHRETCILRGDFDSRR